MAIKSIHVVVPNVRPFDRADWFESFIGHFVLPVLQTKLVQSYWFSRYQDGRNHARFRLKTADYAPLQPTVEGLLKKFGIEDLKDEENYADDEFTSKRWCGERQTARRSCNSPEADVGLSLCMCRPLHRYVFPRRCGRLLDSRSES